jgi:hypothetical protein
MISAEPVFSALSALGPGHRLDLSQLRRRMLPPPEDIEGLGPYGKAVANGIADDAAGCSRKKSRSG